MTTTHTGSMICWLVSLALCGLALLAIVISVVLAVRQSSQRRRTPVRGRTSRGYDHATGSFLWQDWSGGSDSGTDWSGGSDSSCDSGGGDSGSCDSGGGDSGGGGGD